MKKYFAVIYLKNGETDVSRPCVTQEEALSLLTKTMSDADVLSKAKATTIISRDIEEGKELFLFGHPAKYDLCQNKKFLKTVA